MAGIALSLFTDERGNPIAGCEEAFNALKTLPKKRVHYKDPTYTKSYENYQSADGITYDDTHTWGRMKELYLLLSNFFPVSLGEEEETSRGMITIWHRKYTSDSYIYYGKTYKGQDFKVREAEIKGSEDLGIEERLFLHESLLEYLEEGYRLEQLNMWLEELVNWCKQFSARTIVLALMMAKSPITKEL